MCRNGGSNEVRKSAFSGHTDAVPTEAAMRVSTSLLMLLVLFPVIVVAAENKRAPTMAKTAQIEPPIANRTVNRTHCSRAACRLLPIPLQV